VNVIRRHIGWPFLVTLVGVLTTAVLILSMTQSWSCRMTECDALIIVWPVLYLPAAIGIGFFAGREATSTGSGWLGLGAGTAVATVVLLLLTDWTDNPASGLLLLFPFLLVPLIPSFAFARGRIRRRLAASGPWPIDQAPPNHRCGRCGKPLSPVWKAHCKHCGARYVDVPPVPREQEVRPSG
jgi:hypothetical protein